MKKLYTNLLIIFICGLFSLGYAQDVSITYENPLGIEICGNEEVYRVTIFNNSEDVIDSNSILLINLPVGISYVSNSVSSNFLVASLPDVNNPSFTAIEPIPVSEGVTLEFSAVAKCNSYELIDHNAVNVNNKINYSYNIDGQCQSQIVLNDTDNYNLSFRDVSLELPIEISGVANQTLEFSNTTDVLSQELIIGIPGNSMNLSTFQLNLLPTEQLEFIGLSEIFIGNTSYDVGDISITTTVAPNTSNEFTSLIFNAAAIDTSISEFTSNMQIKVRLDFRAKSCFIGNAQHVKYESLIDDIYSDNCVIANTIGDFEFAPLSPSLEYDFHSDEGLNLCGDSSKVTYVMSNLSGENGPAYNVNLLLFEGFGAGISNIEINGLQVSNNDFVSLISSDTEKKPLVNMPGLTDEDGDGDYDDLAPGKSITVTCDVSMSVLPEYYALNNCDSGLYKVYFKIELYSLDSECSVNYSKGDNTPSSFQLRDVRESELMELDTDLDNGEQKTVQLKFKRFGGGSNNQLFEDDMFLEANIEIPCGADFVVGSGKFNRIDNNLELATSVSTSDIGDKTILNIKVTDPYVFSGALVSYGGKFEFSLKLNCNNYSVCTNEDTFLKSTIYGAFSECPDQKINLGCMEEELFLHCYPLLPSCPNENPIVPTGFEAKRASFGTYSDGTPITMEGIEDGEFQGLNTTGAYACDTIRTEISGSAVCGIEENQTLYGYIWYAHPENMSFMSMTGAQFRVGAGALIESSEFNIRTDLSCTTKTVYEIKISGQQINKYDTIKIYGLFAVDKTINNNSSFPDVYNIENFRGGFNIQPILPLSPYHYGTDFEVYGLNYIVNSTSTPASCSNDGLYSMKLHVTGGKGNDFPNEFRNVVQIVGPVKLTIPAEADGKVIPYLANYVVTSYDTSSTELVIQSEGNGVYGIYDAGFGDLEEFSSFDKLSKSMYCNINIYSVLNDCDFQDSQTVDVVASHYEQGYAIDSCKEIVTQNYDQQIISEGSGFSIGNLNLDVINPFFQTVDTVTRYKIDIDNTSNKKAKYPWIKFVYPDNLISISNSTIDGYDIIGAVQSANTLLLKLQPINEACGMEGYIDVVLNNCDFQEQFVDIQIETGISCGPISDTILEDGTVLCPLDTNKKVELEIIKSNLRMDVIPLFDTNTSLQYCDSFQYVVQIYNNEKASIVNPSFQIDVPDGFDMSVQYRYPITDAIDPLSPQFNNAGFSNPVAITNGELWNLEETNAILPGYIANQSEYLTNYYQLLVTLTPSCGFDGASPINFLARGTTNCNEDKELTFQSTPSFSELEVITNYTSQLSIEIEQNTSSDYYTAIIHYNSDTDITGSTGLLSAILPAGLYSTDNLNYTLPSSGNTDFTFNFTTDPEFCGDVNFLLNTIIETELGCNTAMSCENIFELQNSFIENICMLDCVIESVDIEVISGAALDLSCLQFKLNAVTPVIAFGEITAYDWIISDVNNNVIGTFSGNQIVVDLPNVGAPFTAVLNVIGGNSSGNVCESAHSITLTPDCKSCRVEGDFVNIANEKNLCNSVELVPSFTVFDGEVTSYLWNISDDQGNTIETIYSTSLSPETLIYEFSENGIYVVCLEINTNNVLGEECNFKLCKEVIISCDTCNLDAKFSTQKISDCTFQFNNETISGNGNSVEYLWDFGDGNTSTEYEPTHTFYTNGDNSVYLTEITINDFNESCTSTFGPMNIQTKLCSQTVDYSDSIEGNSINLFPNPNNGTFTLAFNSYIESSVVDIYDVLGKIIYQKKVSNGIEFPIDLSHCASGVYLIKVSGGDLSKTKRIVIE